MSRLLFIAVSFFLAGTVAANDFTAANQAEVDYGRGVHAYFDADYKAALEQFKKVEKAGSKDPRPYYYYALTLRNLKETKKAEEYFKKAAQLEFSGQGQEFNVPDALRRIQGKVRLEVIEKFREDARAKWQEEDRKRDAVKYDEQKLKDAQTVQSFTQPNAPQDEKILQDLTNSSLNAFGAKSIEPTKPGSVTKILPRKQFEKKPAVQEEEDVPEEAAKPEFKPAEKTAQKKPAEEEEEESKDPFAAGRTGSDEEAEKATEKEEKEEAAAEDTEEKKDEEAEEEKDDTEEKSTDEEPAEESEDEEK